MKKFLRSVVMMALLAVPFVTQAQITCTTGTLTTVANAEASTTTSSYCPGYSLYNYSYSEVIIPASAIELAEFEVKALEFKPSSTSAGDYFNNCDVYLCNTTQANLSSGFVQDLANFTLVYSGSLNYADTNWQTVVFTNSFQWDGTSNILVAVHRQHGSWTSGSSFRAYAAEAQLARYIYQDSGPYTIGSITGGTATTTVPLYHLIGCATTPSCMRVQNVAATNITSDGLTLTWVDNDNTGATYTVYNMSDSSVIATNLSTTTCTVTGLNANTAYTFGVEVNCSATDNSAITTINTRTGCGIITLPYSMGFEGFATDQLPYCWDTLASGHTSSHIFPTAYAYASNAHTGSVYYEFETNFGETEIAVLPEFNASINNLALSFWACATNIANFVFETGVVESGVFVPYDTIAITQSSSFSSSNYHYYQVFFNNYTGTGDRIALRVTPATGVTSYTFFMDDVEVTEFSGCFPVENLAISNLGSTEMTLTWSDSRNGSATYTIYNVADSSVVATAINDTTYTITNLNGNTQYSFAVTANCSSTSESDPMTVSARTNCSTETFPWSEDFDSWTSKSICWSFLSGAFTGSTPTILSSAWTLNTSYGNYITINGKALTMNVYSTNRYWAVTPAIAFTSDNAMLSVDVAVAAWSAATPNFDANDTLAFAISTDDGNTFTTLAVYDNTQLNALGNSYTSLAVPIVGYNNQNVRIAIFAGSSASGGDNRIAIDNIAVMEVPTCFPVAGLNVSAVTDNSVSLSWSDTINTTATYTVYDMADTSVVAANISGTTYTVTGLNPNTNYTFGVEVNCSATDVARIMTTSARTDCGVEMLPFTEDFSSSLSSDPCWRGASNATAAQVFNGTALNLVAPSSWSFTSSTRCGLDAGHYYKNVYGTNQKAWMITPAIDLSNVTSAQLSFDIALTDYSNAALPDANGDTNTSQAFMVIISTDGGNTWDSTNATIWQNVGGDFTYASLASLTYQNKVIDLSQYAGDTIKIAFYTQSIWSGGDNDLHIDNIAVTEIADTTAPVLDSFVVVLGVNDATMGTTVPAPGTYVFFDGDTATAQAVANDGYHFVRWEQVIGTFVDSTTANPASHVIDSTMLGLNMTMTAIFEADPVIVPDSVIVTLAVNDATMGTVTPAPGTYVFFEGDTATATAVANDGYHFVRWDIALGTATDTMSVNPISVTVDSTMLGLTVNVTAIFEADPVVIPDSVIVVLAVNDATMGTVTPAPGTYVFFEGDTATAQAVANDGYHFVRWDIVLGTATDTLSMNPISTVVDATMLGLTVNLTAIFAQDSVTPHPTTYTVTLSANDPTMGTVTGEGQYDEGATVTITATPNEGYTFLGWLIEGDTIADNPYTFTITADVEAVAIFAANSTGIDDADMANVSVYSAESRIVVRGAEGKDVYVYDLNGRMVSSEMNAADAVEFRMAHTGVYLVKVGTASAKRVVVVR